MKTRFVAFLLLTGILAVGFPAFAHHGNVAYDETKEVVLKDATVDTFGWANPHCLITFFVKDDKGNMVHWAGELGSPEALRLAGWSKTSVQQGDVITVYIHQAKTGNPAGRISHIVLADGTVLPKPTEGGSGRGGGGNRGGGGDSSY
jgi:hypothetical protein